MMTTLINCPECKVNMHLVKRINLSQLSLANGKASGLKFDKVYSECPKCGLKLKQKI